MVTANTKYVKMAVFRLHIVGNTPDSIVNSSKFAIGKDEVTSSNLVSSSRTTPEIFGFQMFFVIKINLGSRRAPALQMQCGSVYV